MDVDEVTGATVEVGVEVDRTPEQVWALVTAIERIGEWSPECVSARWVDGFTTPQVGARFEGHNAFGGGFEATTACVVTAAEPWRTFAWTVLDDDRVDGSYWRFELTPSADGGTALTHRFEHGPGMTGVRDGVLHDPDRETDVVVGRLRSLRRNMEQTVVAMTGATACSGTWSTGTTVRTEVVTR
jgi:uncharacterized protein YndB with AHSA1/START domain